MHIVKVPCFLCGQFKTIFEARILKVCMYVSMPPNIYDVADQVHQVHYVYPVSYSKEYKRVMQVKKAAKFMESAFTEVTMMPRQVQALPMTL